MFSIIIPTYNRAHHLKLAIESVLNQDISEWELIIVDDGSIDNTREVVESFKDSRINYFYQPNSERSVARNNGITKARFEWICFLDSDDYFLKNHLGNFKEFLYSNTINESLITVGLIQQTNKSYLKKEFLKLSNNIFIEIAENFLIPNQVCIHKSIFLKYQFDKRFRLWEDTHLWLRIAAEFPVYQIESYSAVQVLHDEGTVALGMKEIKMKEVNQYLNAINDLKENYSFLFESKLPNDYFKSYKVNKIKMYLYRARQNRQFRISFRLFFKGMRINPSIYFISELPKIVLNRVNIGISNE